MARIAGSNGAAGAAAGATGGIGVDRVDPLALDTLLLAQALGADMVRTIVRPRTLTQPSRAAQAYEAAGRLA